MTQKILLINPPWFVLQNHISTQVPMGLCYLAAALEQNGHQVSIWNADYQTDYKYISEGSSSINVRRMSDQLDTYKQRLSDLNQPIWQKAKKIIQDFNPDYLGISIYTSNIRSALNIVEIAKAVNTEIKIVGGGPHATVCTDEVISYPNIDYVVAGEGETPLKELVSGDKKLSEIGNLIYKNGTGEIVNTPRKFEYEDVNQLPFPAKHLILDNHLMPPISFQVIYSSRGCPYHCTFCGSHNIHGKKIRFRNPEQVVDEIVYTQKRFGTYNFFFCDDTFTANPKHAEAIIDEIIDRKLRLTWSCQTRPENISDRLALKMKSSGCQRVSIGVETGSEQVRKNIKKGNEMYDIQRAFNIFKKHRIDTVGFFMFGFPFETKDDIHATVQFMKELDPNIAHCNIATPDPGTELWLQSKKEEKNADIPVWEDYFHQNPGLFDSMDLDGEEKEETINCLQTVFDKHNRYHFRKDLIRRMPFYLKLILKEKLYRYPRFLLAQSKGLF